MLPVRMSRIGCDGVLPQTPSPDAEPLAFLVVGVGVLAQGPAPAKGAVLAVGVLVGMIWFWSRFLPT